MTSTRINVKVEVLIFSVILMFSSVLSIEAAVISITNTNGIHASYSPKDGTLVYTLSFNSPTLEKVSIKDTVYLQLTMPETLSNGDEPGYPAFPVATVRLLLPQATTVGTITIATQTVDLGSLQTPLIPYQESVPIGDSAPPFLFDVKAYQSTNPVPDQLYDNAGIGYSHGYAILTLNLYPTQYTPSQGRLVYQKEMKITVTLQKTSERNQFYRLGNLEDRAYVASLVVNPGLLDTYGGGSTPMEYEGGLCDPSDNNGQGYDYVIITTSALFEPTDVRYTWDDLIQMKEAQGLHATKVRVENILACQRYRNTDVLFDDIPARIREFCKDAYEDWGTRYVLIAGDNDDFNPFTKIERRLMTANEEAGGDESDLYWSNLDNTFNADHDTTWGEIDDTGFDLYSELFIGSIPCDDSVDISNWLTKSFFYADNNERDYLDSAAFFAGQLGWFVQGDDFIDFSAIKGTYKWYVAGFQEGPQGPYPHWLGYQYGFETWNSENPGLEFNTEVRWTMEDPNPGWNTGPGIPGDAVEHFRQQINQNHCTLISAVAHATPHMSMSVYDTPENAQIEDPTYTGPYWSQNYQNTKPFFLHDYGCHCADMDATDDGVLEAMLFSKYLAFACIYNTGLGWGNWHSTNSSSAVLQKTFWDYLLDISHHSGSYSNWQLGMAHAWAKDTLAPMLSWSSCNWRLTLECCLLFGDPAQLLKPPGDVYGPTDGTVRYINLEGGFYGIVADNGRRFNPVNLPEQYRVEGLLCRFAGHIVEESTIHMWGMGMDLTMFEPRDTIINQQAIVRYNPIEGGFYYLDLVRSPLNLLPLNLPAEFHLRNLMVTVTGYPVNFATPQMFGQPFHITRITRVDDDQNHIEEE